MLLERAAGKTLNPYQGLKPQAKPATPFVPPRRKNPKSLSGIETNRAEEGIVKPIEPEKP